MNLRELTQEQQGILELVENTDLTMQDVDDHLSGISEARDKKIESCAFVINCLESDSVVIKAEIDRLKELSDSKEKAVLRTKEWLVMNMEDGEKHEFDLFKVSRVKGRQVVTITDEKKLGKFTNEKIVKSIDKRALLEALKAGSVDGAELGVSKPSLRIK